MPDKIISLPRPGLRLQVLHEPEDEPRNEANVTNDVRMRINPQQLLAFVRTVYINASLFYFISAMIVVCMSSLSFRIYNVLPVPPYVWLAVALVVLTAIAYIGTRRLPGPLLWTLDLAIVLLVTLFTISFTYIFNLASLILAGFSSVLVIIVMIMVGARCRKRCLPNAIVYSVIVLVCLFGLFVMGILSAVTQKMIFVIILFVFFALLAMTAAVMHSQFIHGRMHYVPLGHELICSLGLYLTLWTMFLCGIIFLTGLKWNIIEIPNIVNTTTPMSVLKSN